MANRKITIVADDLDDLRALSGPVVDDAAFVKDSLEPFDYDSDSLAADDGEITIKPAHLLAGQPGRWIRRGVSESLAGILRDPGRCAVNQLRVAADVVHEQTVTIGADVYEVEVVNTDSTDDTDNGDFDSEDSPLVVADISVYTGLDLAVGDLIRIEDEILRVSDVTGDAVTFLRGQSGTTIAAHADAQDIFVGDGVTAGRIAVGLVTTLTPTAFTPALTADINEHATEDVTAVEVSANEMLLHANAAGAVVLATTETLAGANNAWAAVAMYGGAAPATKKLVSQSRAPIAAEVTLGNMHFAFDFAPTVVSIWVRVAATGLVVAWGGTFAVDGNVLTLTNDVNPDWAATDLVTVTVIG